MSSFSVLVPVQWAERCGELITSFHWPLAQSHDGRQRQYLCGIVPSDFGIGTGRCELSPMAVKVTWKNRGVAVPSLLLPAPPPPFSVTPGRVLYILGNLELIAPKCSHVLKESDFPFPPLPKLQIVKRKLRCFPCGNC